MTHSEQLAEAGTLALDRALTILRIDPDAVDHYGVRIMNNAEYMRLLTLQKEVLSSVLSTTAKVNQSTLKGQPTDRMAELLADIKKIERE